MYFGKQGVSLITVLLFMLVATIAATATYKWISSEGRSSGSRMMQREAYQSAVAGIDNARTWMTFHGNDVGALIRQYMSAENKLPDGSRKSINLDSRLRSLQRNGQDFHVWLTGVNVQNTTYKLKIVSQGLARKDEINGNEVAAAYHNEVAILNVDGLYQVTIPQVQHHANIDFNFAYYGGSYTSAGKVVMTSAVVNGNWSGNPPEVDNNWIVTGNISLSGNDLKIGQTGCIGGNASIENNGITTTDFYVGGNFDGLIKKAFGNVYFNGDGKHSGTGSMIIDGNMTINGFYQTAQDASDRATRIGGNLCVSDSGAIVSKATTDPFVVNGNVWMPGPRNLWYGSIENYGSGRRLVNTSDNQGSYEKIILGDSSSTAYIASAISLATFNSSLKNKGVREISGSRKYCSSQKSSGDKWQIRKGVGGTDNNPVSASNKDICGSWGNSTNYEQWLGNGNKTFYVEYFDNGWHFWGDSTYKPYNQYQISAGDNKYAMYYPGGTTDVDFKVYNNSDWRYWIAADQYNAQWMQLNYDSDYNFYYDVWRLDEGQINSKFKVPTPIGAYIVGGNVFYDLKNYNGYNYDMNAGKATGSPYCKKKQGDTYRPDCRVTPWFRANGTVSNTMPDEREFACAESVMEDCFNIWEESDEGCDGSKFLVDDPLITDSLAYLPYATKGCAASITTWPQSGFETTLNNCYKENAEDDTKRAANLYNGYLVVHITEGTPGDNYNPDANTPLKGKFIIVVDNRLQAGQNGLPRTTADTKVFLFLRSGAKYVQKTVEHYFIYTNKNIGESGQLELTGTLYAPARACATTKFQSSTLNFDQALVQDLTDAGVICQNDGSGGCGGGGNEGDGEGGNGAGGGNLEVIDGGKDSYYISMAPQLGVTVETQYAGRENLIMGDDGNTPSLDPSFIVLPRIIYLPRDPYGKLSDYYSIVPLNGSDLTSSKVNVQCAAGLPAGDLYNEAAGVLLDQKVYRCNASATVPGYSSVPFWVVVNGVLGSAPQVSFVETVQEMSPTGSAQVHANIPAHATPITVLVACPTSTTSGWSYQMNEEYEPHLNNGVCSFTFPQGAEGQLKLFDVTTDGASNGTMFFQLLGGEGYAVTWPFISELHVSNLATINRVNPSDEEIDEYCNALPDDCPAAGHRGSLEWPDCPVDSIWVEPSIFAAIKDTNNSWEVPAGGTGTLTLEAKTISSCVVIIPLTDNALDRSTIEADKIYTLKAIAKARKSSVKVGFVGDVGSGNNPHVTIDANTRSLTCYYNDVKDNNPKACTMDLYSGETVNVTILKSDGENENFNYWKCENNGGITCPTTEPITSSNYTSFVIKDNKAVLYAHFGEVDKHCFFDEFKQGGVECRSGNNKYCIDKCGNAIDDVCVNAIEGGSFTNSKWHLIEGTLSDIEDTYESISIDNAASRRNSRSSREAVKVMSTVEAGLRGTLKALVQLPKATSSFGKNSPKIAKSGFLLHSNATGTEFLMLNVFVNTEGKVEANLCPNAGTENCLSALPKKDGAALSASPSSMVMVEAILTDSSTLELIVFSGNYYETPDTYTTSIKLYNLPESYANRNHEYVGFSMADPNFKIYGIGWSSDDYGADGCWDTYPTVKCSFSAVATDGVIPTETTVEPWVGHSGWFDSKSCTPIYYYDNGTDACSGQAGSEVSCPSSGYYFSNIGAGQHGYRDNGVDVKAAKAWLNCFSTDNKVVAWAAGTQRAHCGMFWTGKFTECTSHADLGSLSAISSGGTEGTITLTGTVNLRGSTLNISLENPNNSPMEVWLLSKNDTWGADDFASNAERFSGTTASFDVVESFADGAQGFDPENVKQVVIKNLGDGSVTNVSISSSCKNAVGISNCQVSYNEANSRWEVSADVSNKSKVSGYAVTGQVTSSTVDAASTSEQPSLWTSGTSVDRATWYIDHNPYESYQGSTFNFSASVTNASGETISTTCTPAVTIGSISCSDATSSNIASGAAWPAFNFKLNNCPQNSCDYEILFDDGLLSGNTACTDGPCSGSGGGNQGLSKTKSGNAEECTTDGGCSHTYTVQSSNPAKDFTPCEVSFVVQKKVVVIEDLATNCKFQSTVTQPGANGNFKADVHQNGIDIRNRDYILLSASGDTAKKGNLGGNSEISFDINGLWTAKSGNFTLKVKNNSGIYQNSCIATLTVNSPNITCSTITENGTDKFKIAVGQTCANNACPWKLVKDDDMDHPISSSTNLDNSVYKIDFSGYGVYKLYINNEFVSGCSITREAPRPTVTCPSAKQNYTIDLTATFKAASVANCGDGCDYRLERTSGGTAFASTPDGTGTYASASTGITFTAPSSTEDDIAYTFTIYDKNDHDRWDSCQGTMAFVESSSSAASSSASSNPGIVACYMNQVYEWGASSMQFKFDNYSGAYSNKSYEVKDASGTTRASGNSTGTNQQISFNLNGNATDSRLTLYIDGTEVCSIVPRIEKPFLKDCKLNNGQLHFQIEKCQNNKCSYQVKTASGTAVGTEQTGKGSGGYDVSVSNNGIYVIWLNGEETSCRIPKGVSMTTPAHCYFPQNRKWGDGENQLKMDNPGQFMRGKTYVVKDAAGNEYANSSNNTSNEVIDMSLSGYYASDVVLYVYVGGELYCTANPMTYGPYAYQCYMENNQTFKFGIGDCGNNKCSYEIKRDGTSVKTQNNIGENGGYSYSASTAGTYVLWLNGKETGCRATKQ